jgi:hypothetical protein
MGCRQLQLTTDAVLATIVAGGQAQIQLNKEVDEHILTSTLIYWIQLNSSTAALDNTCARPPAHQAVWINQIQAAVGASGSITMVLVFVRSFVLFVQIFLPFGADFALR